MTAYLELLNLQQRFMRLDPQLPAALQPEWVGRDAAAVFRARRAAWAGPAHERFREIMEESAPVTRRTPSV